MYLLKPEPLICLTKSFRDDVALTNLVKRKMEKVSSYRYTLESPKDSEARELREIRSKIMNDARKSVSSSF